MTPIPKNRRSFARMTTLGHLFARSLQFPGARVLAGLLLLSPVRAATTGVPRVNFPGSVREVSPVAQAGIAARAPSRIVRTMLAAAENAAPMEVEVALQMRNFAELQARIARGEIIPRAEMAAKYFPLPADYEALRTWLTAKGLTISPEDSSRLSIFARGTVNQLKDVFAVEFARVATDEGEYTSAITAPSVPIGLAAPLLGINGLQPHLRPHKMTSSPGVQKASLTSPNNPPYIPSEILKAYSANTTGLTGAGQTIAIVIDTFPLNSDLQSFWSRFGINGDLSRIQKIQVPGTPDPLNPAALDAHGIPLGTEAVIDAELTSSIAPNATIRIYSVGSLAFGYLTKAYQQIYADLPSQSGMHLVNLSYGVAESYLVAYAPSQLQSDSQNLAALASGGVTVFASSGDGASNPDPNSGRYNASSPASPSHPASDPSVTGVGATTLRLGSNGVTSTETGWSLPLNPPSGSGASGGAPSNYFNRPVWQTGTGVLAGTMRLVPDVSVVGDPATGAYIINVGLGPDDPGGYIWGGTSISAPIWSGFGALINQARASGSLPSLGLFGPKLYPLIGTTSLRDITSGNNGLYNAGVGYDLVTGVGTPVISALVQALGPAASPPVITAQPLSQSASPGQNATFSVTASGSAPLAYQWQRVPAGSSIWGNLTDNQTYAGTNTASLTVSSVTTAMSGDSFQCGVSNNSGTVITAPPAILIVVDPLTITTLAGTAGSSGSVDGTGSTARFNHPSDLVADGAGNVFVTDTANQTIRKITPAGVVSTLAGLAGSHGNVDGTGSAARFYSPTGITIAAGTLYVADTDNNVIRKVTPDGAVTTLATGFNHPSDVTADGAGNLFVADTGSNTIRKIVISTGAVSLVAGLAGSSGSNDGTGSAARFFSPEGVAVDSSGNLYVADTNNQTIRKISSAGVVTTLAGLAGRSGSSDGAGTAARFQNPSDLVVDASGNLLVADMSNQTIRNITPAGLTGTVAGQAGVGGNADGTGSAARFLHPAGVAVDSAGNVYVADTDNQTIRMRTVATLPQITTQPQSQTVTAGATVTFTVVATGVPTPTYQWNLNGTAITGATSSSFTLYSVQTTSAGSYSVTVTNSAGSVISNIATLTVNAATPPPATGGGGGGGGGGAPSFWFYGALSLLVAVRKALRRK
jgi:kumamolisin